METAKTCCKCKKAYALNNFSADKRKKHGKGSYCKYCKRELSLAWRKKKRDNGELAAHYFKHDIKKKYNLTVEKYQQMMEVQNEKCATCGGPPRGNGRYHVDHCHKTGKIRGLLCTRCNAALGMAKDNIGVLKNLISYLENSLCPM